MSDTYKAQISRATPACVVILLDQSWSMNDPFGDSSTRKANVAAGAVNNLIRALVRKCTQVIKEGPRHYFDIAVVGYGQNGKVQSCLPGTSRGDELMPIERLARTPLRVETKPRLVPDGRGGQVETVVKVPVWFDPIASAGTPHARGLSGRLRDHQPLGGRATGTPIRRSSSTSPTASQPRTRPKRPGC